MDALHRLARVGKIAADVAERQINTYLLVPSSISNGGFPVSWLRMPVSDAPHHSWMPDLGNVIHGVLIHEPPANTLACVVELCIQRFRHPSRRINFSDCHQVLLVLVMGLLLGLYTEPIKKPEFRVRACLFARLRAIMTSTDEEMARFCSRIESLIVLACMEYMARVLPMYMPGHFYAVSEGDPAAVAFYRRIAVLADEVRQWLDQDSCPSWEKIQAECEARMERIARLKRNSGGGSSSLSYTGTNGVHHSHNMTTQGGGKSLPLDIIMACWNAPKVGHGKHPSADEFTLFGMDMGIPGHVVRWIQQEVQVSPLPGNLREMQLSAIYKRGLPRGRASYMQTHWPVCIKCLLSPRNSQGGVPKPLQMRLDTQKRSLVCASCLCGEIVHVNLVGRTMRYHRCTFYVCPVCITIQQYTGRGQQPWIPGALTCQHEDAYNTGAGGGANATVRKRGSCFICGENAHSLPLRRIDQFTGTMQEFHYCQRHTPRTEAASRCVNALQLAALEKRGQRGRR